MSLNNTNFFLKVSLSLQRDFADFSEDVTVGGLGAYGRMPSATTPFVPEPVLHEPRPREEGRCGSADWPLIEDEVGVGGIWRGVGVHVDRGGGSALPQYH